MCDMHIWFSYGNSLASVKILHLNHLTVTVNATSSIHRHAQHWISYTSNLDFHFFK